MTTQAQRSMMFRFDQPWGGRACGRSFGLCAEHVRQLEGESPFHNLMEVK